MTYSSSGPSLAQALDMGKESNNGNMDTDVDHLHSNLDPSKPHSLPTSDLSVLSESDPGSIQQSRSSSQPRFLRSSESEKDIFPNHLHHAHLQLHQLETVDDRIVDEPAEQSHLQLHKTGHHSHHSHHRLHRSKSPPNLHIRAAQPNHVHAIAEANALKPRAEQDLVTQVVQTVSVVQVVDSVGSPIEVQTYYAPPATVVVDSASGITVAAISDPEPKISVAAVASDPAASYNVPLPPSAPAATAVETPGLTDPSPSAPVPDATVSDSVPEPVNDTTLLPTADLPSNTVPPTNETNGPVTSADPDTASHETTLPAAPTTVVDTTASDVSGSGTALVTTDDLTATTTDIPPLIETTFDLTSEATQDVSSEVTSNETFSATTDVTHAESKPSTTTTPPTTNIASRTRTSSTVLVVSSTFVTSSINPSDTSTYSYSDSVYSSISAQETWSSGSWGDEDNEGGSGAATADNQPPAATTTSNSNNTDTGTLSPQQKQVIGGVVGSIAGVAFLAFFVLFALRYKKKHPGGGILGGSQSGTRSIGGPTSGPDGDSGASMAERAGASAAITAAFAGLMGKKQRKTSELEPVSERGFYRVSGKKLPSVLQVGGDGYSDPRTEPPSTGRANRESVMSGNSDYWRGSMAFDPSDRDSLHLALGSPMRPISGVPVIRSGPARTPVTESNPFTDPSRPRPDSDALGGSTGGGSIASRDESFGSPSRFQERI
ncbi:hypothetical protein FDENT_12381 [Fusarium denticulatum]|uniref:Uncharacterized protein n=1 Tax=Fusarium denticulatum TaxID=48507 RepID=A0A8H5WQ62_9HYPO|nr:hypothetical protein FDENT_12381 [Fusarium denticulatum]